MRPDLRTLCAAHNGSDPCAQVYGYVSVCVCVAAWQRESCTSHALHTHRGPIVQQLPPADWQSGYALRHYRWPLSPGTSCCLPHLKYVVIVMHLAAPGATGRSWTSGQMSARCKYHTMSGRQQHWHQWQQLQLIATSLELCPSAGKRPHISRINWQPLGQTRAELTERCPANKLHHFSVHELTLKSDRTSECA